MTEQEKRYVAEEMLGWDYREDEEYPYCVILWGDTQMETDIPDFTLPEWLGPLWKALCEKVRDSAIDGVIALGANGIDDEPLHEASVVDLFNEITYAHASDSNPNLAVIAAYKALEGE